MLGKYQISILANRNKMADMTPDPQGSELSSELQRLRNSQFPLEDSARRLADSPEDPTVWKMRRLLVVELKIPLEEELDFVGEFAKQDSRNHLMWQHRQWIVEKLGSKAASKEFEFTKEILWKDSKIYQAWSHRAWIIEKFGGSWWLAELQYCHDVLVKDIFNIFAWDQRCRVVRLIPDMEKEFRDKEVSYAKKAIQAQPWNESAWAYLKCLYMKDHSSLFKEPDLESVYVDVLDKEARRAEAVVDGIVDNKEHDLESVYVDVDVLDKEARRVEAVVDGIVDKRGCVHALNLILDLMFLGYEGSAKLLRAVNLLLKHYGHSHANVYHHWNPETPEIFRNVCSLMICLDAERICFCNNYSGFSRFQYLGALYRNGGGVYRKL